MLFWDCELSIKDGSKVVRPWIGPYKVTAKIGRVGYELRSEVGNRFVRAHANRLRMMEDSLLETGSPVNGIFPDITRIFQKTSASKFVAGENDNPDKCMFDV